MTDHTTEHRTCYICKHVLSVEWANREVNSKGGMVELIDIVRLAEFKFSVNISTLNKNLKNAIKLVTGVQFPDVRHCPIALLANNLCKKFKKRKCSKEKFISLEEEWLRTTTIQVDMNKYMFDSGLGARYS